MSQNIRRENDYILHVHEKKNSLSFFVRKAIDIAPSTEIPLKLEQAIIQQNCFLMNTVEIRLESF